MECNMKPIVSIIVAHNLNGVIGSNGTIPWSCPEDLQHFKNITTGHPVIMGRKTWESLKQPLVNRTNIVVTTQHDYYAKGAYVANSIEQALTLASSLASNKRVFVIGGEEIYRQAIKYAHSAYVSVISNTTAGDAYFNKDLLDNHELVDSDALSKNCIVYMFKSKAEPASYTIPEEVPAIDSCWLHNSGNIYCVRNISNSSSTSARYPQTVIYEDTDGGIWSRPLTEWHKSMTLLEASSTSLGFLPTDNNPALAVMQFAFANANFNQGFEDMAETVQLLSMWYQGDFQEMRDTWPDIPDEVFIGADPLFKPKE